MTNKELDEFCLQYRIVYLDEKLWNQYKDYVPEEDYKLKFDRQEVCLLGHPDAELSKELLIEILPGIFIPKSENS